MSLDTLATAIVAGNAETVAALLAEHPQLAHGHDARGVPLLLLACYHRQPGIVALLREARARIHVPLDVHEAAALGEPVELAAALANAPMGTNTLSADGFAPLHLAAFFGRIENTRLLLAEGADPALAARNASRVHPLHSAAAARQLEIARMLVDAGADLDAQQEGGWTALHAAAAHGDEPLARLLLAAGANPSLSNEEGRTPFDVAVEGGHDSVAASIERAITA